MRFKVLASMPWPVSATFATPEVAIGFVVGAIVTSGGSGYVTSPAVNIADRGGSNATASAQISGGVVTNIVITSAGIGYTNRPKVQIAAPPAAAVSPTVPPVMRVDIPPVWLRLIIIRFNSRRTSSERG